MTDYDDFKKFGSSPAPQAAPSRVGRTLTVGLRSDGQVAIISSEDKPGANYADSFVMDRPTARWLAKEILRATELPSEVKP